MFAGKSTELLRRIMRYQLAKKKCIVIKYARDNRYGLKDITRHDQHTIEVISALELGAIPGKCLEQVDGIIGIDEGQFYPDCIRFAELMVNKGKIVIIAALDADFKGRSFNGITDLVPSAEKDSPEPKFQSQDSSVQMKFYGKEELEKVACSNQFTVTLEFPHVGREHAPQYFTSSSLGENECQIGVIHRTSAARAISDMSSKTCRFSEGDVGKSVDIRKDFEKSSFSLDDEYDLSLCEENKKTGSDPQSLGKFYNAIYSSDMSVLIYRDGDVCENDLKYDSIINTNCLVEKSEDGYAFTFEWNRNEVCQEKLETVCGMILVGHDVSSIMRQPISLIEKLSRENVDDQKDLFNALLESVESCFQSTISEFAENPSEKNAARKSRNKKNQTPEDSKTSRLQREMIDLVGILVSKSDRLEPEFALLQLEIIIILAKNATKDFKNAIYNFLYNEIAEECEESCQGLKTEDILVRNHELVSLWLLLK
ncbi:Oidioi.mRNA.OKI2018_I69.chr1.g3807.t1.cds [Oikopleura dioica]|uniref:Thymidine kinase, cytosolic n=1 Tax=Oikopleura dioica TaxID=34765 RepID=A0ABN7SV08_OIKDI|nr:Oidioi.mRNA.OKI2018_I69.chr1.g3807.t1.cds [Oikopleura dioica]